MQDSDLPRSAGQNLLEVPPVGMTSCRHGAAFWALIALVLLPLFGPAISSFALGISATLERDVVGLGDVVQLNVQVDGGGNELPEIPDVPGLQIQRVSTSRQIQFVNGQQSALLQLGYAVGTQKIGTYRIGPITVKISGRTYATEALGLRVVAANDPAAARKDGLDKAAFIQLVLPKPEVYVGETFVAEVHLYAIGGSVEQAPQIGADGFTVGKMQNLRAEPNIRTNDRVYSRVRFLLPMTAARAGDLEVSANNCVLNLQVSRRQGFTDAFDEMFGGREMRRLSLVTDPVKLKVLPLPTAGQPAGFNGAVGDFQLALSASPTNLQAGDPITLHLLISGRGNFDSVAIPEQPAWRAFRTYPPTSNFEPQDGFGFSGLKKFEQVLTPESSDITELPPFLFSFFNPSRRAYQTLRSAVTPLHVTPGANTPNVPDPANTAAGAAPSKPELAPLKAHLGPVAAATPATWLGEPWFLTLNLLPPLAWISARSWRKLRDRHAADSAARRKDRLLRQVASGLASLEKLSLAADAEGFHASLFRVLQDAVAARTGQPHASITEGILDTALAAHGLAPETVAALHALFRACNQARYARQATPGDLNALRLQAVEATRALQAPPAEVR